MVSYCFAAVLELPLPMDEAVGVVVGTVLGRMPLIGIDTPGPLPLLDAELLSVEILLMVEVLVVEAEVMGTPEGKIPDGINREEVDERVWKIGIVCEITLPELHGNQLGHRQTHCCAHEEVAEESAEPLVVAGCAKTWAKRNIMRSTI